MYSPHCPETFMSAHEPAHLNQRQNAMKAHFDRMSLFFSKGDKVHIKKPVFVQKARPKSTPPVRKKVGPYTYLLDDGKKWHASCLAVVMDVMDNELIANAQKVIPSHVPVSGNSVF